MPHALLLTLCLLVCGCSGGARSESDEASDVRVASEPCVPSEPAQRDSKQILVVIGADSDEPAGPLAVVRRDGRGFRDMGGSALVARWSPDGRRIAYIAADNFTPQSSLRVINADGRGGQQLVADWPGYNRVLEWSPDGGRILYDRGVFLWSIRVDGSDKRRLARDVQDAEWSPDGRSIAFVRNDDIYLVRSDGGGVSRVVAGGFSPKWAAGGDTLVFEGAREREPGLYAVAAGGGEPRPVVLAPQTGLSLADVSPDGCWVLAGDATGLVAVSLDDGTLRRLTRSPGDLSGDWSPDGRRVAFLRGDDLWVVGADGDAAKLVWEAPGTRAFSLAAWQP